MHNGFTVDDSMRNSIEYDGATLKFGITVNNENYIVKLPKKNISSLLSEHIASQFIHGLGINCHETWIGYYNGNIAVIMRDFTNSKYKLRSYRSIHQSKMDTSSDDKDYTYKDILNVINSIEHMKPIVKQQVIEQFWEQFICDAILGNRDRHWGNWGYLVYNNNYKVAPIYDNGGSLFPGVEEKLHEYTNKSEYTFIYERSEKFPASLFKMVREDGKAYRTNYNEILGDLRVNKTLARKVREIKEKVGFEQIYRNITRVVRDTGDIMDKLDTKYKRFYIVITCVRYLHLVERRPIKQSYMMTIKRINADPYNARKGR